MDLPMKFCECGAVAHMALELPHIGDLQPADEVLYFVACAGCGKRSPNFKAPAQAATWWNKQAELPAQVKELRGRVVSLEDATLATQSLCVALNDDKATLLGMIRKLEALIPPAQAALGWIDDIWPANIFDGSSGDIGPVTIARIREDLRKAINDARVAMPWLEGRGG